MRTVRETTTAVAAAQELVERALRARDAAEAQRTADDKADDATAGAARPGRERRSLAPAKRG